MTDAPLDIAIVIALQEEFEQLHARIKDRCTPVQDPETNDYDYVFTWPAASAQPYRCVASFAGKMGEQKAALVTQRLLARWQPATVVVLGIAGGIDSDVRLGDVVAATAVESYLEDAKAVDAAEPDRFDFRLAGDTFRPSGDLAKEIRHFKFAHSRQFETWQEDGRRRLYDALPANLRNRKAYAPLLADGPRLLDGPVACGPIVGAAESFVAWLKRQNRKFVALEMESGGVLAAVFEATDPARTLVLRGISDLADHRKADLDQTAGGVFRRLAMNNAIGLLDALLAAGCLPRAHVAASLRDAEPGLGERRGPTCAPSASRRPEIRCRPCWKNPASRPCGPTPRSISP